MKKPRRILVTLELETTLTVAQIRRADRVAFGMGTKKNDVTWIDKIYPLEHRLIQVKANAIRPEPQPRSQRARMAKFAKDDAERADPKRPGWFLYRIAEVQSKPERKAKRAKGAK